MKYIFVAGAPGSKWSSVVKNIYFSPSIDQTDYSEERLYYHDASGKMELMHLGAYFDPGMEFGDSFDRLNEYPDLICKQWFDEPFNGVGVRIIKSHVFANHIDYLKHNFPDCPIVLVHRPDDACLGWWVKCGHFDITYPSYDKYYVDLKTMAQKIKQQNAGILKAMNEYPTYTPTTNIQLARALGIALPPEDYQQNYITSDIKVTVI